MTLCQACVTCIPAYMRWHSSHQTCFEAFQAWLELQWSHWSRTNSWPDQPKSMELGNRRDCNHIRALSSFFSFSASSTMADSVVTCSLPTTSPVSSGFCPFVFTFSCPSWILCISFRLRFLANLLLISSRHLEPFLLLVSQQLLDPPSFPLA